MTNQINNKKDSPDVQPADKDKLAINHKVDELVTLITGSNVNSNNSQKIKLRINKAIYGNDVSEDDFIAYKKLDTDNVSRTELLDEFSILLSSHKIDSKASKKYLRASGGGNILLTIISLLMITLGFAMIVMPAPPDFEIYTVFYFNTNDGITIMDLISLLIVLSGIYLLIKSLYKRPVKPKQ